MRTLTAVPTPAQVPAAPQDSRLYLQSKALTGIQQHLLAGGTDREFLLRLAANALRGPAPTGSDNRLEKELPRHPRGLEALHRRLAVGGTDTAIRIGLTVNALTGFSPATVKEAEELAKAEKLGA